MTTLEFDGSNAGGLAYYGFYVHDDETGHFQDGYGVHKFKHRRATNNDAEFVAVGFALRYLKEEWPHPIDELTILGDSRFVINMLNGVYSSRYKRLRDYCMRCWELIISMGIDLADYDQLTIKWIPREMNERCDFLASLAKDMYAGTSYHQLTGYSLPE